MSEQQIEFSRNYKKPLFNFCICLVFVFLGIWMVMDAESIADEGESIAVPRVMGLVCAGFFGLGIPIFGYFLLKTGSPLIIKRNGVVVDSLFWSPPLFIPWEDIVQTRQVSISGNRSYIMMVRPFDKYMQQVGPIAKLLWKTRRIQNNTGEINFSNMVLGKEFDRAVEMVEKAQIHHYDHLSASSSPS